MNMEKETKNLCAQIPVNLHRQLRERQEASGQSLSEYMTWLITSFYETEGKPTMNTDTRTVAFQVPADLFEQFKEYLQRHGLKQKDFFLDCIQRALADNDDPSEPAEPSREDNSDEPEESAEEQWQE